MIEGMDCSEILLSLASDEFSLEGQFVNGSNYTFLGKVQAAEGEYRAVYKPTRGEIPLWDFQQRTLAKREVAAYLVSEALGWRLVPPTVYRRKKLPYGPGMLQFFVDHNPQQHYFTFTAEERARQDVVAVFDEIINNADRKSSHVLRGLDGRFYCIDHGVCFHVQDKLRTVIWEFAGKPIRAELLDNLSVYLNTEEQQRVTLKPYLRPSEINALFRRIRALVDHGLHRVPGDERRMYPYPPV
jgi:hypothetical protein